MGRNEEFEDEVSRMRERKSRGRSRSASARTSASDFGQTERQNSSRNNGNAANKKKRKPKRSKKRTALRIVIIIIEVIVLLGIAAYAYVASKFNLVQRVEDFKPENIVNLELTPEQKEVMEGYKTIAIFGVDARDSTIDKGTHSDVIMICNIDMGTGEIKLVSVFRDTYLNINDKNSYRKINAAYFDGGPTQAVKALNKNLDLNIEDYITFNWTSVIHAINILDGVDIEINSKELYYLNAFITETVKATGIGSTQIKKTGVVHMDGVQAVAYGRLRLMDSDYVRTERQKIVVKAAFEKAKKASLAKLNELAGNILADVSTSMDWSDAIPLIENISKFYLGDSLGFPMARGEMRYKGGDYVVPQTLESNVIELHQFLFANENYEPTSTLKKISTHIAQISGFTKPGKNAGSVVIGGDSSSTKSTTAASKTTAAAKSESTKESTKENVKDTTKESTKEEESGKETTAENGESGSRPNGTEHESAPGAGTTAANSTKHENESSGTVDKTTSAAENPSSPGRPSNVTVNPSSSNGDLIHQEPTKATTEPGIYEEPGKIKETTGNANGLTPGGSPSTGTEGTSGAIITNKSPSDIKGQTTAAPTEGRTTAAEPSSAANTTAAANQSGTAVANSAGGNTSNANPLNPNPTGNTQSPSGSGNTAPSAPSAPSSVQKEPGNTAPSSNAPGGSTLNPAAPGIAN